MREGATPAAPPRTGSLITGVWSPLRTMSEVYRPRDNAIGALRLVLAVLVIISHAWPLGFERDDPVVAMTGGQTDLGRASVYGFFALSGLLITTSAMRLPLPRFLWARFLRIYPGFAVSTLVVVFVLAPTLWVRRHGDLAGYWSAEPTTGQYLRANWSTHMGQYALADTFSTTPYGNVLNGSLWTLRYEIVCYLAAATLAVIGGLRRRPWITTLAAAGLAAALVADAVVRQVGDRGVLVSLPLPIFGELQGRLLFPLAIAFALGGLAAVFPRRFPMDGRVAGACAVALAVSLVWGGFLVYGVAMLAYLVLWLGCTLTGRIRRIGVKRDVSYGVYIYAFPVQQTLTLTGVPEHGFVVFTGLSIAIAIALGAASWYAVERPMLRLKDVGRRPIAHDDHARADQQPPLESTPR